MYLRTLLDLSSTSADPENFVKGVQLRQLFFYLFISKLKRGRRIQIPILGCHHRPTSETPFKLRFAGVLMISHHRMLSW